nr:hypothetical protein [Virgibacillus phasianinus]
MIWIMAIFNTTAMALDIVVLCLNSIFTKTNKIKIVILLAPLVYLISMLPQNIMEVTAFGSITTDIALIYTVLVGLALFVMAKIRGVNRVTK